jgi:hypothetical protein
MDNNKAFVSARVLINTHPPPEGVVDKQGENYNDMHAFASAVKYVARHVSSVYPPNIRQEDVDAQMISANHMALKTQMSLVDRNKTPAFFTRMLDALRDDKLMKIPDPMYRVAFATQLFGDNKRGMLEYNAQVSTVDSVAEQYVYDFLFSAGYKVVKKQE